MPPILRAAFSLVTFLSAIGYALGRGGRPERQAALIMVAALLLTWALISPQPLRYRGPEFGVAFADSLALIAMVWLALTADRDWPLWLAAMQAVVVLSHLAATLKPVTIPHYYKNTVQLWIYPQLAVLAVGTLRQRLRTSPSSFERRLGALGCRFGRASSRVHRD